MICCGDSRERTWLAANLGGTRKGEVPETVGVPFRLT